MKATVSVHSVSHPRYKFVVTHPEIQPDGTKARRKAYFLTKKEAESFAAQRRAEVSSHGARHSSVQDEERVALMRFRSWSEGRTDAPSLLDLVNEAIAARERVEVKCSVRELVDLRLRDAERSGLSQRHQHDLLCRLRRFEKDFGARQASSLSVEEITAWLHEVAPGAQNFTNYKRVIGSAYALGVRLRRVSENPVMQVSAPKIKREAPAILSPSDLHSLLSAASARLRPLLVLQAFAGLRRAESERISWGHIHLDDGACYVEMPSSVTKTNRRRVIELPANAVAWLRPLYGNTDGIFELGQVGYNVELKRAVKSAGIEWSTNVLRHSFGSYRLAQIKNAAQVAEEMGNSPQVVRTHYQNLVRPEAVIEYWKVTPERVSDKVRTFPAQKRKAS
ncbi:MAG: tyrosine-type recombinase/integrase [Verrucomicrobiaceae bacterium]|nr:tyrosine-type recombinase/integrase [Verrucomicrobiaceae bacterium]